ncbi:MAG: hypothetical protein E7585_04235 [Ruminococcaceae bacterium]|nr:hypothetical protein [Oscillospiraceae bacterium]
MKIRKQRWQDSYIVRFFVYITNWVYGAIEVGFIGRLFTSYCATDRLFRHSGTGRLATAARAGRGRVRRTLRRHIALAMNHSLINRACSGLLLRFCRYSLRTFGAFFVTAGAYSAVMYWLFSVVWQSHGVEIFHLFSGTGMLVIGVLMLFSDVSLGYALSNGFFFRRILVPLFGVPEEAVSRIAREGRQGYMIAVPLGMAVGAVSALTSPFYLLAALIAFLLFYLVLSIPESGVVILLLFLPFAGFLPNSERWLFLVAALPLISYFGKLLRGKRAFHMEAQDLPVLLMVIYFLLSGVSVAGASAWKKALLSALCVGFYFLVVNVIATPNWLRRCRTALVISAMMAALTGIAQFLLAALKAGAFSLSAYSASVSAGFADQTTFAYYLVVAFPFALVAFITSRHADRVFTGLALLAIVTASVLTWVHSAMIAIIVMLLAFLLLYQRYSFPFVLIGSGLFLSVIGTLPPHAKERFFGTLRSGSGITVSRTVSAGNLAGKFFFEKGSGLFSRGAGISRLFFGVGSGGIEEFCLLYTSLPSREVARSLNFWLYSLMEGGVLGILLPAAFFFLFYQNCFSLMRKSTDQAVRLVSVTGVVMLTGVLLISIFRYAWYDPAALLVFFVASALIVALARYERSREVVVEQAEDGSEAEIEYYG